MFIHRIKKLLVRSTSVGSFLIIFPFTNRADPDQAALTSCTNRVDPDQAALTSCTNRVDPDQAALGLLFAKVLKGISMG